MFVQYGRGTHYVHNRQEHGIRPREPQTLHERHECKGRHQPKTEEGHMEDLAQVVGRRLECQTQKQVEERRLSMRIEEALQKTVAQEVHVKELPPVVQ